MRHALTLGSLLVVLFGAGAASAKGQVPIPKQERAAIRKQIRADAAAQIKLFAPHMKRTSVAIPTMRVIPTGQIVADAEVRALVQPWPNAPLTRMPILTATFSTVPLTNRVRNTSGWQVVPMPAGPATGP